MVRVCDIGSLVAAILLFTTTQGKEVRQSSGGFCLDEHNQARSDNGLGPLTYDDRLQQSSQNHDNTMTSQNCFSHQCSGEPNPFDRMTQAGYTWSSAAENIAAGVSTCQDAVNMWMGDEGHRDNILGNYVNIGCAMAQCDSCDYNSYWTCDFASPM